jgi:hypothetical protein
MSETRPADIRGKASTFATVLIWDDAIWDYQRVIDCVHHRDARAEFMALHNPPLVLVESVRINGQVFRP